MLTRITDIESFKDFLRKRAQETWVERQTPYYMSFVANDLKKQGINYHNFTGPLRLVQWASKEKIPDTRLVSHPTVKAKVGLIPENVPFEFDDDAQGSISAPRVTSSGKRGQALIDFVEALTSLSEEAAENYSVPSTVLIALLNQK